MNKSYKVNLNGISAELPIVTLPNGVGIAFFNLHGNPSLTEHCGKSLARLLYGCDVLLTAESKGLQLTHVIAREMGHERYAVARKNKKLYMNDGLEVEIKSSVTTGTAQRLFLSAGDAALLYGKRVGIVDDVISTGNSEEGLALLVSLAGGTVFRRAFVLAEGASAQRTDIVFLDKIPLF